MPVKTPVKPTPRTLAAQQQWTDLYFRHNFLDAGLYPTSGSLSSSPDIIPAGASPYADPSQLITDNNWQKDFGASTTASQANYIYTRGQNLGAQQTAGKLYLYASQASLLLYPTNPLDPTKGWSKNPIRTSGGAEYVTVNPAAGARFVSPEPFNWIPDPIYGDHYCLVSRVVTKENPNPIPTTGNLNDFGAYISSHPNMAWRNVVTMNPANPTWSMNVEYDQGEIGGWVYLFLTCRNAPNGSRVMFSSGTPGPNPPIAIDWTTVQNQPGKDGTPTFTATLYTNIPANYHTNITYSWDSKGLTPLPDMEILLEAVMPTGANLWDPALDRYGRSIHEIGHLLAPGVGPTKGLALGSQTMRGQATSPRPGLDWSRQTNGDSAAKSSIFVAGFSWAETTNSVIEESIQHSNVALARVNTTPVETEVLMLAGGPKPQPVDGDLSVDVDFNEGPTEGTTFVTLDTTNVPVGCEVWFHNLTGSVSIKVPTTKVNSSPTFSVGVMVDLPLDYSAKLQVFLKQNGHVLPADWSMKLSALHIDQTAPEANQPLPKVIVGAGPKPGTLLGAVTIQR